MNSVIGWMGSKETLDIGKTFKYYTTNARTISYSGTPVKTLDYVLVNGWTWVGIIDNEPIEKTKFLKNAEAGHQLQWSGGQTVTFVNSAIGWMGAKTEKVQPGSIIKIKSSGGSSFTHTV